MPRGGGLSASFLDPAYMVRLLPSASSERTAFYLGFAAPCAVSTWRFA